MASISTPCTGICTLDPASSLCAGCGRHTDEIMRWLALSEAERLAIMAELPARRARAFAGDPVPTRRSPPSGSP